MEASTVELIVSLSLGCWSKRNLFMFCQDFFVEFHFLHKWDGDICMLYAIEPFDGTFTLILHFKQEDLSWNSGFWTTSYMKHASTFRLARLYCNHV